MICDRWATAVVPFPFTDKAAAKRRPALVVSGASFNADGHTVMAMMTTKTDHPWPGDVAIQDLDAAGLPAACVVRWKLFTIDNRLILRVAGALSEVDRLAAESALHEQVLAD